MLLIDPPNIIQIVDDERPTIELSKLLPIIKKYVHDLCENKKEFTGEECTRDEKDKGIASTLKDIALSGRYRFIP